MKRTLTRTRFVGVLFAIGALLAATHALPARAADATDFVPSPEDVIDVSAAIAANQIHYCSYPGPGNDAPPMYTSGDCKYNQAAVTTRCTSYSSSSGRCYKRQFQRFFYRGGTAKKSSSSQTNCQLGSTSHDGTKWQLTHFGVYDNVDGRTLYTTSSAHYALRTNCGVEAQLFYGRPVPFDITHNSTAVFVFKNYHSNPASDFVTTTAIPITVGEV